VEVQVQAEAELIAAVPAAPAMLLAVADAPALGEVERLAQMAPVVPGIRSQLAAAALAAAEVAQIMGRHLPASVAEMEGEVPEAGGLALRALRAPAAVVVVVLQ
jgi:hypothetical protein